MKYKTGLHATNPWNDHSPGLKSIKLAHERLKNAAQALVCGKFDPPSSAQSPPSASPTDLGAENPEVYLQQCMNQATVEHLNLIMHRHRAMSAYFTQMAREQFAESEPSQIIDLDPASVLAADDDANNS